MEQKTIFITGASRGIGKSIALLFASRGYHTFLNCSSSVDELKKLRAYITEKYHTPCTLVPGNVGNPDHVRAIYNKIYQECTHLDVLVNNAGISYMYLPPYSPDLNPIEKMWSKMKAILRKNKIRVASELPEAVKTALKTISENDCKV